MKTENFFWAKYHQCGKCLSFWMAMNRKSNLTLSDGDFKSKQHYGLCELLSKKSQETLNSVWLGTAAISKPGKTCQKFFLVFKKKSKYYYAKFQKLYGLQWIRILSTFETLMTWNVFQEHLQFKWCPSPSNDNEIDTDYATEKGSADMHVWHAWSSPEKQRIQRCMWTVTYCFSRKPYVICWVMLHKWLCTEHKQIQGHWGTDIVLPEERIPYMSVLAAWIPCKKKRSIQNYPIIQSLHSHYNGDCQGLKMPG